MAIAFNPTTSMENNTAFSRRLVQEMYPEKSPEEKIALAQKVVKTMSVRTSKTILPIQAFLNMAHVLGKIEVIDPAAPDRMVSLLALRKIDLVQEDRGNSHHDPAASSEGPESTFVINGLISALRGINRLSIPVCQHPDCQIKAELKKCARCKGAMYCGQAHQHADWGRHKEIECVKLEDAD